VPEAYHLLRHLYVRHRSKRLNRNVVFAELFHGNGWNGKQSASGTGSDADQTAVLVRELPALLRELGVSTMLDLPCGDFHWMQNIDLDGIRYLGGDIVDDLVVRNRARYEADNIAFQKLNLLADPLPAVDLVLCRDCLVHFSFMDVWVALDSLCRSGSKYLLTTTFPERVRNADILSGNWRPLNLCAPPFRLPAPLRIINEQCTEVGGAFSDKSLALWRIEDIAAVVEKRTGLSILGRAASRMLGPRGAARTSLRPR
jgi:hypothetical protein